MRGDTGSPTSLAAGSHTISLSHEGRERPYLLHLPPATGAEGVPLVLELHGRGIDPLSFDCWTRFRHFADQAGFVVALPSAVGEIWNDGRFPRLARDGPDDVGYLVALIEDACTRFLIDMRRIYVVGMSNGATMAARLVCEQAGRIAAFAQVAGTAARGGALSPVAQHAVTWDLTTEVPGAPGTGLVLTRTDIYPRRADRCG